MAHSRDHRTPFKVLSHSVQGGSQTPFKFTSTPLKSSPLTRGIPMTAAQPFMSTPSPAPVFAETAEQPNQSSSTERTKLLNELTDARNDIADLQNRVGTLQAQLAKSQAAESAPQQPVLEQAAPWVIDSVTVGAAGGVLTLCVLFSTCLTGWQWAASLIVATALLCVLGRHGDKRQKTYFMFTVGLFIVLATHGQTTHTSGWSALPFWAFTCALMGLLMCHMQKVETERLSIVVLVSYLLCSITTVNSLMLGLGIFLMLLSWTTLESIKRPPAPIMAAHAQTHRSPIAAHPRSRPQTYVA